MFSRALALLCIGSLLAGCGMRFDPIHKENAKLSLGANETGCLTGAAVKLGAYWDGKGDIADMDRLSECASSALQSFSQRVRGAQIGQYSPAELRNFVQTYFVRDFKVNDRLLERLMLIKQAMIGGSRTLVSSQDLAKTREFIGLVTHWAKRLAPFMPLSPDHLATLNDDQFYDAVQTLLRTAQELSEAVEKNPSIFGFAPLNELLEEIDALPVSSGSSAEGLLSRIRATMPRVQKVALGLVGPVEGDSVTSREWAKFIRWSAGAYALYLRQQHLEARFPSKPYPILYSGGARERMVTLASDVLQWIEGVIETRQDGAIPYAVIADVLGWVDWEAQWGIPKDTIIGVLQPLNSRLLRAGVAAPGITAQSLATIRSAIFSWNRSQRIAEEFFVVDEPGANDRFRGGAFLRRRGGAGFGRTDFIANLMGRGQSLLVDGDGRLLFPRYDEVNDYTFSETTHLNWMNEISGLLVTGYGESRGSTRDGVRQFYSDVRDLGVRLKLFDRMILRLRISDSVKRICSFLAGMATSSSASARAWNC